MRGVGDGLRPGSSCRLLSGRRGQGARDADSRQALQAVEAALLPEFAASRGLGPVKRVGSLRRQRVPRGGEQLQALRAGELEAVDEAASAVELHEASPADGAVDVIPDEAPHAVDAVPVRPERAEALEEVAALRTRQHGQRGRGGPGRRGSGVAQGLRRAIAGRQAPAEGSRAGAQPVSRLLVVPAPALGAGGGLPDQRKPLLGGSNRNRSGLLGPDGGLVGGTG